MEALELLYSQLSIRTDHFTTVFVHVYFGGRSTPICVSRPAPTKEDLSIAFLLNIVLLNGSFLYQVT